MSDTNVQGSDRDDAEPTLRRPIMFGTRVAGTPEPWTTTRERLRTAVNYWVVLPRPDGAPHARPVWGVWMRDAFWYSTDSQALALVAARAQATVHLESGDDVVIVEGRARIVEPSGDRQDFVEAYNAKYSWDLRVTHRGVGDARGAAGEVVAVEAECVLAWSTRDLGSAACWELRVRQPKARHHKDPAIPSPSPSRDA